MTMATRRGAYPGPACPHCNRPLEHERLVRGANDCPFCNRTFEAVVFHPPERSGAVLQLAAAGPEGASPCGNHARNAAVAACSRCGMFICDLCRVDAEGQTFCPGCFERMLAEGTLASTQNRFRDYGGIAGTCAAFGLFIFITGPFAIYFAILAMRQRRKLGEVGNPTLMILALILGLGETVFLLWMVASMIGAM